MSDSLRILLRSSPQLNHLSLFLARSVITTAISRYSFSSPVAALPEVIAQGLFKSPTLPHTVAPIQTAVQSRTGACLDAYQDLDVHQAPPSLPIGTVNCKTAPWGTLA